VTIFNITEAMFSIDTPDICFQLIRLIRDTRKMKFDLTTFIITEVMFSIDMANARYAKNQSLLQVDWWIKRVMSLYSILLKLCFQLIRLKHDTLRFNLYLKLIGLKEWCNYIHYYWRYDVFNWYAWYAIRSKSIHT